MVNFHWTKRWPYKRAGSTEPPFYLLSLDITLQSGASGCEKSFVKCFLRVPQAVGLYCSCHADQGRKGNFQKTFYKTFFTIWRPRLYCTLFAICGISKILFSQNQFISGQMWTEQDWPRFVKVIHPTLFPLASRLHHFSTQGLTSSSKVQQFLGWFAVCQYISAIESGSILWA